MRDAFRAGFVASISWVASYVSLAASACSDAVNSKDLDSFSVYK